MNTSYTLDSVPSGAVYCNITVSGLSEPNKNNPSVQLGETFILYEYEFTNIPAIRPAVHFIQIQEVHVELHSSV